MSLLLTKNLKNAGKIGIWKIEENDTFFRNQLPIAPTDEQRLSRMHAKRQVEWLAGRYLVSHLEPNSQTCAVDSFGKPYLPNSPHHISISHSGNFASAIINPQSVGIDIQKITTKIQRIAHKFMRPEETACLQEVTALEHLHVFWGAKEALYKAYGKKKLDFREHIWVEPFEYNPKVGRSRGFVSKDDFYAEYELRYEKVQDCIMVYCIER